MQTMKRTDKVFVDKGDLVQTLGDRASNPRRAYLNNKFSDSASTTSVHSTHSDGVVKLLNEQRILQNEQTEAAMKHNITKGLELAREKKEKLFPVLLTNVNKAQSFLDTIDKDLSLFDETKKNKTRRQFEEWNTTVHGDIQKRISESVNKMDSKTLNRRKNADYNQFLEITNRKPAIFRDIIIESEYDPLEPNRQCIVAKSGYLKDPVKIDAQKAAAETAMLGDGKKKPKQKLGKDTLPVELWASGKIEATPYGTFAKMMAPGATNPDGTPTKQREGGTKGALTKSSVVFDHFEYPSGRAAIDVEMPRGKRIHPITIYADPRRQIGNLPAATEREIADMRAPETMSWASKPAVNNIF